MQHAARQVTAEDFRRFTHILAADEANLRALQAVRPRDATAEVRLWGSYLDNKPIADPYYGNMVRTACSFPCCAEFHMQAVQSNFEECYAQCVKPSNAFLDDAIGQ